MRIHLTHCSAKKDDSLHNSTKIVTPDKLYMATPTQRFMSRCKEQRVKWAIFSATVGSNFASFNSVS
jgi:homoserine dehydrogenase